MKSAPRPRHGPICLFCVTSTRSGIGDGFLSLVNNFGDDVLVIKGQPFDDSEFGVPASHIHTVPFSVSSPLSFVNLKAWWHLLAFLRRHQTSHLFFYSTSPINALVTRLYRRATYSLWCHDPLPHPGEPLRIVIPKELDLRSLLGGKRCKRVFVASHFLKDILEKQRGGPDDRIKIVPLPYIHEILRHAEGQPNAERAYDLIFWGRIEAYKGLDALAAALEILAEGNLFPRTLIVGRGPVEAFMGGKALQRPNVEVKNLYVTNEDLCSDILNSKVAIFPYHSSTGTHTIQTSMALGCRIIATNVGSFKELVAVDGTLAGKVVEPRNPAALAQAIADELAHSYDTSATTKYARCVYDPRNWVAAVRQEIVGA